jgi:adenine-specific DNA methylase
MIDTDKYEYIVTHFKSGESDGIFATYEEAKAHYDSHDEEWREAHYVEEVRKNECAWCACTNDLNYLVNGAWETEYLCENCYQDMVDTSQKDFGIHNPYYPLYVRRNEE